MSETTKDPKHICDPERIFIQPDDYDGADDMQWEGRTWCNENITDEDTEYVRVDIHDALHAEADALHAERDQLQKQLGAFDRVCPCGSIVHGPATLPCIKCGSLADGQLLPIAFFDIKSERDGLQGQLNYKYDESVATFAHIEKIESRLYKMHILARGFRAGEAIALTRLRQQTEELVALRGECDRLAVQLEAACGDARLFASRLCSIRKTDCTETDCTKTDCTETDCTETDCTETGD